VVTGREARAFVARLRERKGAVPKELTGIIASSGKAVGRVRICFTPKESEKVEKGDILVTTMTRPEFVSAMKRAGAVVTDEGGLTSHAAIISRELGIPCVIGTKHATKRLKEGSVVEVNANHGVVKVV
jgi:pyruvate,water dikinase